MMVSNNRAESDGDNHILSVMPGAEAVWSKNTVYEIQRFVGPTLYFPHSVGETVVSPNAHLHFQRIPPAPQTISEKSKKTKYGRF
jgi:hypothetical protein